MFLKSGNSVWQMGRSTGGEAWRPELNLGNIVKKRTLQVPAETYTAPLHTHNTLVKHCNQEVISFMKNSHQISFLLSFQTSTLIHRIHSCVLLISAAIFTGKPPCILIFPFLFPNLTYETYKEELYRMKSNLLRKQSYNNQGGSCAIEY